MNSNFHQTINLRQKTKNRELSQKAEEIDKIYESGEKSSNKIEKPKIKTWDESQIKKWLIIIFIILFALLAYFYFGNKKNDISKKTTGEWYAVKLVDNEIHYGKIVDTKSDPVVMENVYYNYDQTQGAEKNEEAKNIRLVKRGKEAQGGDGSMNIVRSQILYMEPMSADSKVLKAILEYEK